MELTGHIDFDDADAPVYRSKVDGSYHDSPSSLPHRRESKGVVLTTIKATNVGTGEILDVEVRHRMESCRDWVMYIGEVGFWNDHFGRKRKFKEPLITPIRYCGGPTVSVDPETMTTILMKARSRGKA